MEDGFHGEFNMLENWTGIPLGASRPVNISRELSLHVGLVELAYSSLLSFSCAQFRIVHNRAIVSGGWAEIR